MAGCGDDFVLNCARFVECGDMVGEMAPPQRAAADEHQQQACRHHAARSGSSRAGPRYFTGRRAGGPWTQAAHGHTMPAPQTFLRSWCSNIERHTALCR